MYHSTWRLRIYTSLSENGNAIAHGLRFNDGSSRIDAGTSVIKAVAFDLKGNQIAVAAKANHYEILPNGGVEQELKRTGQTP